MAEATSSDERRLSIPRPATNTLRTTAGQKSKTGQRESKSATGYTTLPAPCRFRWPRRFIEVAGADLGVRPRRSVDRCRVQALLADY